MSNAPPGLGGEDFGGSIAQGTDGKLYVQAGKTGYWNLEVTGLETTKAIPGGRLTLSRADTAQAASFQAQEQQVVSGPHLLTVARLTPTFTGDLAHDFAGANTVHYGKSDDSSTTSAAAYDAQTLYLAWDVRDNTPWVNGATTPENLYLGGDTVDFQMGTDSAADTLRGEAGPGDLRLSLGPLWRQGHGRTLPQSVPGQEAVRLPLRRGRQLPDGLRRCRPPGKSHGRQTRGWVHCGSRPPPVQPRPHAPGRA